MPVAYWPSARQVEVDDLAEEAVGHLDEQMPAPSPVFGLGARARRGARGCRGRRCPAATMSWLARPFRSTTKLTPHASCSKRGS